MDNDFCICADSPYRATKTSHKALIAESRGIASEAEIDNWLQHVNRFESEALGALSNIF